MHPRTRTRNPLYRLSRQNRRESCQMKIGRKSMPPTTGNWNVSDLLRSPLRRTLSWGTTLKTSKNSTTTNWSVNDLLTSALQGTLAWEKTVKTSTTTNNSNVNVLLHNPLQRRKGHDRRHFNERFHHLRFATRASRRDVLSDDLGHVDNLAKSNP